MKRILVLALFSAILGLALENQAMALEKNTPAQSDPECLMGEMSLKTWLGIAESERIKIARDFMDDYYRMDKTCSYAKIKAFYNEKEDRASLYVECIKRSAPVKQETTSPHLGT